MNNAAIKKVFSSVWRPLLSIAAAIAVSSIILIIFGYGVIDSYKAMFIASFKSLRTFGNLLNNTCPLIFCGLAVAISYRSSVFNIGAEGQFLAGTIATCAIGIVGDGIPRIPLIIIMIAAGMAAGAAWAFIPGFLKAKYDISEIITTIMFNYIALQIIGCLTRTVMRDTSQADPQSFPIADKAWLPYLISGTKMNSGIVFAIIAAIVIYILLFKTPFGFDVRAVGYNKTASLYAGIKVEGIMIKTMLISGMIAGLGGAVEVMGSSHYIFEKISNGFGYTGIAVSVLANNNPIGAVLSALLFGFLKTGSSSMQRLIGTSAQFTTVIQAIIIIFVAISAASNMGGAKPKKFRKTKKLNTSNGKEGSVKA